MHDYYSSSSADAQTTSSSSSYDQPCDPHTREWRHRRQLSPKVRPKMLAHGPWSTSLGGVPRRAPPFQHAYPPTTALRPPYMQPPLMRLPLSPSMTRSSRPHWLLKSPSVGEMLKMYSAEQMKKKMATRTTAIEQDPRKQTWSSRREVYDDDDGGRAGLPSPCIPVVVMAGIAIVILLCAVGVLVRNAAQEFPAHYGGPYGQRANEPEKKGSSVAVADGPSNSPERPMCARDSCSWQKQYLLGKLNWSVHPCRDFYSHVCSKAWFKKNQSTVFKGSVTTMLELWEFLQEQPINVASSFASQASLIMRGCVRGSRGDKEWITFRKIFRDLGIEDWPYDKKLPFAEVHDIAKVADKMLGLSTLVSTSLKPNLSGGEPSLYVDSPPILLRRYESLYLTNRIHKYNDFVAKAMSLWKPPRSTTSALALEVVHLEQAMSDVAAHSARSVPVTHVIRSLKTMRSFLYWDWYVYFNYFLHDDARGRSSGQVVLLDPPYFDGLSTLLSEVNPRVLANYVGYKLLVNLSPLLPGSKASFLIPLSHQHHLVGPASDRLQACTFLLESLYPFGTRSLVWTAMLTKSTAILSGDLAHDLRLFAEQARFEMKQRAAAAPWMTQNETELAISKIERMKIVLTPSKEELALRFGPFETDSAPNSSKLLGTYYNLVRFMRTQYWAAKNPDYFREPATPTETSFLPGFAYDPTGNVLTLSPATVAFVSAISRRLDSTSVPFLLSPLLRGMFSAMDSRGCNVDADGDARNWWTPSTKKRFKEKTACIQNAFVAAASRHVRSGVPADVFEEENVMNSAVLRPLYNIFQLFAKGDDGDFDIPGEPKSLNAQKLFFINWASTLCEPPRSDLYHKQSVDYRLGVPGKLVVNVALSRFPPFSETFECPVGSLVKSVNQCTFW